MGKQTIFFPLVSQTKIFLHVSLTNKQFFSCQFKKQNFFLEILWCPPSPYYVVNGSPIDRISSHSVLGSFFLVQWVEIYGVFLCCWGWSRGISVEWLSVEVEKSSSVCWWPLPWECGTQNKKTFIAGTRGHGK